MTECLSLFQNGLSLTLSLGYKTIVKTIANVQYSAYSKPWFKSLR